MTHRSFKIAGAAVLAVAFTAGTAFAGGGENCKDKKKSAMKTTTSMTAPTPTRVLSTSDSVHTQAKAGTYMSFDKALKVCQDKGAADLQACVDYKTGVTKIKPQT